MSGLFEDQKFDVEATLATSKKEKNKNDSEEGQLTVDVYQTDEDVVVQSTIAGITSDDIDIAVTNDMITIKGKRQPEEKVHSSDYYYRELYWGPFSRTIILPEDVDSDATKANLKNGVLTVRMPKLAKTKIKKIKIS